MLSMTSDNVKDLNNTESYFRFFIYCQQSYFNFIDIFFLCNAIIV